MQIINIQIKEGLYLFDIVFTNQIYENFVFKMPGRYNLLNAAGSILACMESHIGRYNKHKILNFILPFVGLTLILHSFLFFDDKMFHP